MGALLPFVTPDLIRGPAIPGGGTEEAGPRVRPRVTGLGGEPCAGVTEAADGGDDASDGLKD